MEKIPPSVEVVEGDSRSTSVVATDESSPPHVNIVEVSSSDDSLDRDEYPLPTDEERATLRKVPDSISWILYALCVCELAERASYYSAKGLFSNFMQFPLPKGGNGAGAPPRGSEKTAGALGKGLQFANSFVILSKFLAYALPVPFAWWADAKFGRYNAIILGVLICGVSHVVMVGSAIPSVLQAGNGTAPFLTSLLILAIGAAFFKPCILPTVLDQYTHQQEYTKVLKSGEKVIVDPETTIQRISLIFYGFTNIGAIFTIATVYIEKYHSFWLAFLLPTILYFTLPLILLLTYKKTHRVQPKGSEMTNVWKIILLALKKNKCKIWATNFWDVVKPSVLRAQGTTTIAGAPIPWNDKLVEDVRRTIAACALFLYFPLWHLNDGGIGSVLSSQGSTMTTNGAPNDLLINFNPLTSIVFAPLLSHLIYPALARYKIHFGRINRITFGFTLAWIGGVLGTILQWRVYETSPCGYHATGCDVETGVSPLSVWLQVPTVALGATSECFCTITAYEIAYARSPKHMRALVMSYFLLMHALCSALGQILAPAIKDPNLVWVWGGPSVALAVQTVIFWIRYRHINNDAFLTYEKDYPQVEEERKED
ncbi:PTR2-domain-containing protein [Aulographum hederae CBS 113979]|uniref:PTR2-domain-containing protein n=1 Tax=Aulographum hederae CBS 113979 TaxID=1176131 RepID=A0A6G1HF55_9PEZI|nr:PTR2-domain-containing protein [Aulographum hederae CBS 113979]